MLWSQLLFFEGAYYKYNNKKSKHMPSQCYALVILFHFYDVFIRNTYFEISERVDLVVN